MNDELKALKKDYRDIEAPPGMSARVSTELERASAGPTWWPRYVAAAAMLLLALPLMYNPPEPATEPGSPIPSLSQLVPQRPQGSLSSMGSLRSVSLPAMPARPASLQEKQESKPDKRENNQLEQSNTKENFHEYA